jgi:hypothetical protein
MIIWITFSSPCKERRQVTPRSDHLPAHQSLFCHLCALTWSRSVSCKWRAFVSSRSWFMVSWFFLMFHWELS